MATLEIVAVYSHFYNSYESVSCT